MESVIYITKKKVFLTQSHGKTASINWNGQDLRPVFKSIKQKLKLTNANVVLGNDLSYTLAFAADSFSSINRQAILEKAQEQIPENLDNHNFDWQKKDEFVQVVATPSKILNSLSLAANANKLKLNSIQAAATILAQSTSSLKNPHLVLHQDQESLIITSFKSVAFFAHNRPSLDINTLVNIASITKQKYKLDIKTVVISGSHVDKSIDVPAQWEVVKKNINIMAVAAKIKKTQVKDQDELEIKPVAEPIVDTTPTEASPPEDTSSAEVSPEVAEATPTPEISFDQEPEAKSEETKKPNNNKGLFVALAVTLVVGGALTGGIIYSKKATGGQDISSKAAETTPLPTTETTPTPTPTPEKELDLTEYTIQVQNGSGTAGQAGAVDEILQAEGFNQADTTNADSYDYQDTEVQLKKNTPKAVYETIERALNSDYNVILGDALEEDSRFDIIITVGQKN